MSDSMDERTYQQTYIPKSVKNRHIDGVIIEVGLVANLPDGSTNTKAFFATDENKLYIWNPVSEVWVSVALT